MQAQKIHFAVSNLYYLLECYLEKLTIAKSCLMMKTLLTKKLTVKKSPIHGYGVFAGEKIEKGEVIEECYAILTAGQDRALNNYYFGAQDKTAVLTGLGFIYNHSEQPNATYFFDELNNVMVFQAKNAIETGEEIVISYGENWFDCRSATIKEIPWWRKLLRFTAGAPLRFFVVAGGIFLLIKVLGAH